MGDVKVGDRVKVARPDIEGEVTYSSHLANVLDVELHDGSVITTAHIDVVTKLASPLKVGDKIEGKQAFLDLPVGAVVGDGKAKYNLLRTAKGFAQADGIHYPHDDGPEFTRKILFLPGS